MWTKELHIQQSKKTEEKLTKTVNTVGTHTCQEDTKYIETDIYVTRWTILRKYAKLRADRPPRDDIRGRAVNDMYQGNEETMVTTQEFDMERSKVSTYIALDQS